MTNQLVKYNETKELLSSDDIRKRFADVLGERTPAFLATVLSVVYENDNLRGADPQSIVTAAMKAAVLNLPVDPNLGFAWIVPYKDKATFQLGYKGYIQLALRTGEYAAINAFPIYKGERVTEDRMTGKIVIDGERESDEITHYGSYFRLHNGYEHAVVMSMAEIEQHAQKYSQAYNYKTSAWQTNPDAMRRKTVLKKLLSKWGPLSVDMRQAFSEDEDNGIEIDERMRTPDIETVDEPPAPLPEPEPEPEIEQETEDVLPKTTKGFADVLVKEGLAKNEMIALQLVEDLGPGSTCPADVWVEVAKTYIQLREDGKSKPEAVSSAWLTPAKK